MTFTLKKMHLLILAVVMSCVSLSSPPLKFEDRTYLFHPWGPWLVHPQYAVVCKHPDRILFKKCMEQYSDGLMDLNEASVRDKFIKGQFECKSKNQFR